MTADTDIAGGAEQHKRDLRACALLVAHGRRENLLYVLSVELDWQPACLKQIAYLLAQLWEAGQLQRDKQPQTNRLAVTVALVAGDGLERVPDRVPQVEHLAAAGVALVLRDHRELCACALADRALVQRLVGGDTLPSINRGDEGGLLH